MKDALGEKAPDPEEPAGQTTTYDDKLGLDFTLHRDEVCDIQITDPLPKPPGEK